ARSSGHRLRPCRRRNPAPGSRSRWPGPYRWCPGRRIGRSACADPGSTPCGRASVAPRPRRRPEQAAGNGSMTAMDAGPLHQLWHHAAIDLAGTGHRPSRLLVLGTALVALAAVASARIWPVARTVVTIAHEGGHALMALLAGRRVNSVRVLRSTAGVTV